MSKERRCISVDSELRSEVDKKLKALGNKDQRGHKYLLASNHLSSGTTLF